MLSCFSWIKFSKFFFLTSVADTFEKLNKEALFKSFIAIVPGWFAYFNMVLKIGREILSAKGTTPWKSGIFRSITALEKNLLKISAIFTSSLTISSSVLPSVSRFSLCSTNVIFSDDFILSESKGFTVRQNYLLSVRSFSFKFA